MMQNIKLVKNYIYNTLYQILTLVAPLITIPYVSRVLGATSIGIYNYTHSIATYFMLVGAVGTSLYGQREIAYLQDSPQKRSEAFWEIEIFRVTIVALFTLAYTFFFGIFGRYPRIYLILAIEVFATAFDISWFFMGMENFKLAVVRNAIIKITAILCVFIFVKSPSNIGRYTACMTFPVFMGNISLWLSLKKNLVKTNLKVYTLIKNILSRVSPILILFLPQIAIEVYTTLDKTMIGLLSVDMAQVGYYAQAQKIIGAVLMIVTSAGTVMLSTVSVYFAKGDIKKIEAIIKQSFRFTYMICFALLFILCAIVSRFVPFFFGDGYLPVISLIIIISPIIVTIAIDNIIGVQYLLPTNQQKYFTFSVLTGAIVNFILNMVMIPIWDAVGASIATVVAEFAVTIVFCLCVRNQLPIWRYLASGVRYFICGVVMFITIRLIASFLPSSDFTAICVMMTIGIVTYVGELLLLRDPMLKKGLDLIREHNKVKLSKG